mmetsp:Transcript_35887/g.57676  ORF Transcript_35887/g.57676 Transcript_35887/m.57676 type:complete len:205 (-) Transcript_35887:535-1149(-)
MVRLHALYQRINHSQTYLLVLWPREAILVVDHRVHHVHHFGDKHLLFGRRLNRPKLEQSAQDDRRHAGILEHKLHAARHQLLVELLQFTAFMQRHQHVAQEVFVLLLDRNREAVDDGAEYLEELGDAVLVSRAVLIVSLVHHSQLLLPERRHRHRWPIGAVRVVVEHQRVERVMHVVVVTVVHCVLLVNGAITAVGYGLTDERA